ncbi:hypothetical protein OIU79_011590 [Salix purpurea]|uniref:Uncharacterized protein n=1 Tax=Salix purpurea TaxID=77065 RepID=A0A9Q0Q113_SALPP|nr:hypothetical protein OIU79_011590 [Salix purpurea]
MPVWRRNVFGKNPWIVMIKCGRCGEVSQKETCVTLNDTVSLHQGKGTSHLIQKCKFCGRDGTVTMIPGKGKPLTQELSEGGKYAPLMLFDFRGYEPEGFVFSGAWNAESEYAHDFLFAMLFFPFVVDFELGAAYETLRPVCISQTFKTCLYGRKLYIQGELIAGTKYEDIDLSGDDFNEYDEKGECPVMISNLRSKFEVVR